MLPNECEPVQWSAHPSCSGTRRRLRCARGALARPCETSQLVAEARFAFALRDHRGDKRRVSPQRQASCGMALKINSGQNRGAVVPARNFWIAHAK